MMPERASRTFICSVLFLDIVEYSRKPVAEQIRLKDRFNALIASAIQEIPPADRIILDTGDGVAINFLGDPEDALFVAMSLRDAFAPDINEPAQVPARIGINLGPVRLVRDLNSRPNIIGDGINVAQRVMAFADAGQILVSRSYYEIVSHISEAYSRLFSYEGSRTDKHVREHEVYSVGYSSQGDAVRTSAGRMRRPNRPIMGSETQGSANAQVTRLLQQVERWLGNRSLAYGTAAFSTATFLLALLTSFMSQAPQEQQQVRTASRPGNLASAPNGKAGPVAKGKSSPASDDGANEQRESGTGEIQAAAAAEEQTSPAPERKKKKLRLPFFGSGPDDESVAAAPEQEPGAASQEQPGPDKPALEMADKHVVAIQPSRPEILASAWPDANRPESEITESATVSLAISPWGEVYVDGKHIGVSPPVNEVQVTPGQRVIEIRNGSFPPYTQRVELKARQKIKLRYKFN